MARPRKRIQLEDGVKLDVNKLRVRPISQGETTQQVICCYPRYSSDARRFGLLVWRFSSATRGPLIACKPRRGPDPGSEDRRAARKFSQCRETNPPNG